MRFAILSLLFAVFFTGCGGTQAQQGSSQEDSPGPGINTLITEVQKALIDVQLHPDVQVHLPDLDRVELELNTSFDKDGKLKVNLFILEAGGGISTTESQAIKLTMKPPEADPDKATNISGSDSLAAQLEDLIIAVAEGVVGSVNSEFPLEASSLEVSLKFGVTKTAGGGAAFEITPISIEAGGEVKAAQIQSIVLVFK